MLYIPIILGTARKGRQSEKAANFLFGELKKLGPKYGFETELVDVRNYRIPATDNTQTSPTAKKLEKIVTRADGFVIVSPEYNHGYPGELKMMLDMLYNQYSKKPVGFCGVSIGPWGGNRVVEQLRLVAIELHMVPIREALYFAFVQNLFDENGNMKDAAAYEPRIEAFLDELAWHAKALKQAREKK